MTGRRVVMKTFAALALLVLGLSAPAGAQELETASGDLLRAMIELDERPDRSDAVLPLAFGREPQDVDVNSTISIRVSPEQLTEALRARSDLAARVSPQSADLLAISAQLRRSVDVLGEEIANAAEMARLIAEGRRDSEEFRRLATRDQRMLRRVFEPVRPYWEFLETSSEPAYRLHAADSRRRADASVLEGRHGFTRYLVEEVKWVVDQLNQAGERVSERPPSMALVLSAAHHGREQQVELGLPGYNRLPVGAPVRFDKLNLVPSAEQLEEIRRLRGEAAALAEVLNPLLDGSRDLGDTVQDLLRSQDFGFGELKSALDAVVADVDQLRETDWQALADDLKRQLEEALADAGTDEIRRQLEAFESTLGELLSSLKVFGSDLQQVIDTVDDLTLELPDLTAAGADPVALLSDLLSAAEGAANLSRRVQDLFGDLRRNVPDWIEDVRSLAAAVRAIRESLLELPDNLSLDFELLLSSVADQGLTALVDDLGRLRDGVRRFVDNLRGLVQTGDPVADLVALAAATRDLEPPETSFEVPTSSAEDTWLDVQTINPRREGDTVSIRAWLYRVEPTDGDPQLVVRRELLSTVTQQLRIFRFGWYTAPSVGLTYLSSFDKIQDGDLPAGDMAGDGTGDGMAAVPPPERTESFVPQVSWMFRHRSWDRDRTRDEPARYRPKWHDSIGLGFHTVALDLDNDNQLEVGLGVTISLFNDYVQLGVGVDLSLDEEPYFFLGTRLFELARSLGIRSVPAATPGF